MLQLQKLVQKSQKNEVRQISLVFNGVLFFAVVGLIVRQQKMKSIYLGGSGQSTDSGPKGNSYEELIEAARNIPSVDSEELQRLKRKVKYSERRDGYIFMQISVSI